METVRKSPQAKVLEFIIDCFSKNYSTSEPFLYHSHISGQSPHFLSLSLDRKEIKKYERPETSPHL